MSVERGEVNIYLHAFRCGSDTLPHSEGNTNSGFSRTIHQAR
ncbi:hypothetical protein VCHA28FP16_270034 [Vibrio chagasii]|nr:hypothetical protein VCHA28FP16_270034 [Vibrio chagasii]